MTKRKIVLDADVIINFSRASILSRLTDIMQSYDFIVLDKVYNEILGDTKRELDNNVRHLKKIAIIPFPAKLDMIREYAKLVKTFGKGESACMAYCKFTDDVVGSSNFKDVSDYCKKNDITYLGTVDFLYYAVENGIMTEAEAIQNMNNMIAKGSRLPKDINFKIYKPTSIL
jgi:predicted nucleic acid-binding protein